MPKSKKHSKKPANITGWVASIALILVVLMGAGYVSANRSNLPKLEKPVLTTTAKDSQVSPKKDTDLEDLDTMAGAVNGDTDFADNSLDDLAAVQ